MAEIPLKIPNQMPAIQKKKWKKEPPQKTKTEQKSEIKSQKEKKRQMIRI